MDGSSITRLDNSMQNGELYEMIVILESEGCSQLEIMTLLYQLLETKYMEKNIREEDDVRDVIDAMENGGNKKYWHTFKRPWTQEEKEKFYQGENQRWRDL